MKTRVILSADMIKNPAFWEQTHETFYYSGHLYRGSAYESDDTCSNCDGANCEHCRKITVESHYRFICYTDAIYEDLVAQGIDKDIAADLAYSDYPCRTHYLAMPTEIPEATRLKIETPDKEVWNWCENNKNALNNDLYVMRDKYRILKQSDGISWLEGLNYYLNQIDFWYKTTTK